MPFRRFCSSLFCNPVQKLDKEMHRCEEKEFFGFSKSDLLFYLCCEQKLPLNRMMIIKRCHIGISLICVRSTFSGVISSRHYIWKKCLEE